MAKDRTKGAYYRHVILAVIGCSLACTLTAAENLKIALYCPQRERADTEIDRLYHYRVYIAVTNSGDRPVKLPTAINTTSLTHRKPKTTVVLTVFAPRRLKDGTTEVEPESRLAPVELRPGETVIIETNISYPGDLPIDRLIVCYVVDGYYRERYGFWSGILEGPAIDSPLFDRRPVEPNGSGINSPKN